MPFSFCFSLHVQSAAHFTTFITPLVLFNGRGGFDPCSAFGTYVCNHISRTDASREPTYNQCVLVTRDV